MRKPLYIVLGAVCTLLGAIGIFVPVLPTTPFLLAASWLFLKSSRRLHLALLRQRVLGAYLYRYSAYHGVSRRTKINALILLWTSLAVSIAAVGALWVRVLLSAVGLGVTMHLLHLRTLTPAQIAQAEQERQALIAAHVKQSTQR